MDLQKLGEFRLIDRIRQAAGAGSDRVLIGIGDDTAVIDIPGPMVLLVGTDAMVEGRHFRLDWMSPRDVGIRAAAACMSDIAAMGGRIISLFASICFPDDWTVQQADELISGIGSTAAKFDISLAGGDTSASDNGLFIDIIALGDVEREGVWQRDRARAGDRVFVTGTLGDAAAALALLAESGPEAANDYPGLFKALLSPTPRLREVPALAATGAVTSCIDISDGLLQDAGHIATASGVGVELHASELPVSEELQACAAELNRDAMIWAASGGEDFELLLTADPDAADNILATTETTGTPITEIGRVSEDGGARILDDSGDRIQISSGGWDHFSSETQFSH
ncbi:MAG: thiamine-phosphate kinase [Armatimonadota bacterium]